MQERSADVWKKNILEDLELGNLEYEIVEEFLTDVRKEFEEEMVKIAESKRLEQRGRTIEKFV